MRDPELVFKAQLAAASLERAWQRWRLVHGLAADAMPAVSSYVGYSVEEPWGQPRVVFGLASSDAEQLAALLERHDCIGPVHAMVAGKAGDGVAELNGADEQPLPVPRQAPSMLAEPMPASNGRPVLKPRSWRADAEDGPVYRQVSKARWAEVASAVGEDVTADEAPEPVASKIIAQEPAGEQAQGPSDRPPQLAEQATDDTAAGPAGQEHAEPGAATREDAGQNEILDAAAGQDKPGEVPAPAVSAGVSSAVTAEAGIAAGPDADAAQEGATASETTATVADAGGGDAITAGEDAAQEESVGKGRRDSTAVESTIAADRDSADGKDAGGLGRSGGRDGAMGTAAASSAGVQDDPERAESADEETPGPLTRAASTAKSEAEARIRAAKRERRAAAQRASRQARSQQAGRQPGGPRQGVRQDDPQQGDGVKVGVEGGDNATEAAGSTAQAQVTGAEQTSEAPAGHSEEAAADAEQADAEHADAEHADAEHADAEHADAEHADAEHADAIVVRPPEPRSPEPGPRGRQQGRGRRNRSGRSYPIPRLPKSKKSGAVPGS